MPALRSFIALPVPADLKSEIAALIADLQSIPSDVKWEDPEKLHLTLRFLGNVDLSFVEELSQSLRGQLSYHFPFEITYEGLGAFPTWARPRVIWIGVRADESLSALQRTVEEVVIGLGREKEDREFHAHLTIGRVKGFRHLDRLTAKAKSVTFEPVSTLCNNVLIVKSELHPAGSRYTVIHSIPLNL
ncbi:MAG: RNA 2',3'-cyclic phosphodiesterase [Ignavibacteriales bacterium]|nr:RNA 2',3'-cyclic phosphodiesterase [Ignavibacteriales bacterium]